MNTPVIDSKILREALSSFATGVTIVTTVETDGTPVGMTASSFNSVSMEPPLVLWSVTKTALSAPVFKEAEHFSIHVLSSEQMNLSNRFAKSGTDKFDGIEFGRTHQNIPTLSGALTRFDCKTWSIYEGGDHWIIVGEVIDMESKKGEGLVFSGGSYAIASSIQAPDPSNDSEEGPIEELLIYHLSRAYANLSRDFHTVVEASGLTITEWRVLAQLHGGMPQHYNDLVTRTFVSPKKMNNVLAQMKSKGWLSVEGENGNAVVTETALGHEKVDHLFKLAQAQETTAMGKAGKQGQARLMELLRTVVNNTDQLI